MREEQKSTIKFLFSLCTDNYFEWLIDSECFCHIQVAQSGIFLSIIEKLSPHRLPRAHTTANASGAENLSEKLAKKTREESFWWENGNFHGYYLGCTIIARRAWRRKKFFNIIFYACSSLAWTHFDVFTEKNLLWLKLFPRVVLFLAFNTFMTHELGWTE